MAAGYGTMTQHRRLRRPQGRLAAQHALRSVAGGHMSRDILDRSRSMRILIGLLCVAVGIYIVSAVWSVVVLLSNVILLFLLAWIIRGVGEGGGGGGGGRGLPRVVAVSLIYFALLIVVSGAI